MSNPTKHDDLIESAAGELAQRHQFFLSIANGFGIVFALLAMGIFAGHGATGLIDLRALAVQLGIDGDWLTDRTLFQLAFGALLVSLVIAISASFNNIAHSRRTVATVRRIEAIVLDRAMRDPLTGLHNRSGFKTRLDDALENRADDAILGVIYIDLDKFKDVNDTFGHEMGDQLLVAVAESLRNLAGPKAEIARLGGDEFAMVVYGRRTPEQIEQLGHDISSVLGQPFLIGSTELSIGGSVGMVVAPMDGIESTVLVRRADISMYRVKAAGRGQALRFDASMEDELRRRKFLEGELRHAIGRNQLQVWYQPYMASDGENIVGVEALLRWVHPDEGIISPGVFIPLAEESGLIVEIGEWTMRRALNDALDLGDIHMAINVSPVQFRRPEFLDHMLSIIGQSGVEAKRVEIEITEGVLMEDAETAIAIINGFRGAGIHVALDDFGTGYASLSYLRRFPFDKLKVDQAFVRNLGRSNGSAAIIHGVVSLGRSLGMTVHAEGVETLEHHIFLRAAGCHHFQGFYFAKPMPLPDLHRFIEAKRNAPGALNMRLHH
ncbi:EAL domain-containing protein [Rhabdaerophilum sp. SD176]|uniref:putative bifunctional diguanylate cyclase/phosphodiesterase n=1 Tax=Rhabdaerophilum sp. SD176 TaxID=2983548 RepID=UPI0024DF80D1|nr:EAL domain-containing protein [Rhabdaerophilum sp. SD176]